MHYGIETFLNTWYNICCHRGKALLDELNTKENECSIQTPQQINRLDLLQEYKDLYYKEIDFGERLHSRIVSYITFLTLLIGLLGYELNILTKCENDWKFGVYLTFCCFSVVLSIIMIILFIRTYVGYNIEHISINDIHQAINKCYNTNYDKQPYQNCQIDNTITLSLAEKFINLAISQRHINSIKSKRYKKLIFISILNTISVLVTYLISIFIK